MVTVTEELPQLQIEWHPGICTIDDRRTSKAEHVEAGKILEAGRILHHLAILHQEQGKYLQAEVLYEQALTIKEQELGEMHPSTGVTLHNLGRLYQAQGKYPQA